VTSGATPGFRQIEKVARDSCGGVPGRWRSGPSDRLFFWAHRSEPTQGILRRSGGLCFASRRE
jgi:hypothetical protein